MAALDLRIHGGTVPDESLMTAGVPAMILSCPSTAHQGRQIQWGDDGSNVSELFVCAAEDRPLYFEVTAWAEVAASMAWFIGLAPEAPVLDSASDLDGDDLVGFYSAPGEASVQLVARRSGVETSIALGTFSDGGMIPLGMRVQGSREGVAAFTRAGDFMLARRTMPEASVPMALTVAATQTASTARQFAFWSMLAAQDRKIRS